MGEQLSVKAAENKQKKRAREDSQSERAREDSQSEQLQQRPRLSSDTRLAGISKRDAFAPTGGRNRTAATATHLDAASATGPPEASPDITENKTARIVVPQLYQ